MTRSPHHDPYLDAKLLGILLAGGLGQTRPELGREERLRAPHRCESGVHRLTPAARTLLPPPPGWQAPSGDE